MPSGQRIMLLPPIRNISTLIFNFSANKNEIVIPAGVLHDYVFNPGAPKYLNYGALGAIIGHEMSHGFDNTGHKYDEIGKYMHTLCRTVRVGQKHKV